MTGAGEEADHIRVILADANVLYSRVLRDYLLYAADQEILTVAWSGEILREVAEHVKENIAGFDDAAAGRLVTAMNGAYPLAEVEPGEDALARLAGLALPDEDDRHVLAAAIAADATVLCTANISDFPAHVAAALWLEVLTPDELLTHLAREFEVQMLAAHRAAVASLPGATDHSTMAALRKAGAKETADLMAGLLRIG
jgi:predicted nucleic acid-binding protein